MCLPIFLEEGFYNVSFCLYLDSVGLVEKRVVFIYILMFILFGYF